MRVFGVDYQFLSCGSVFTDGLAHAAEDLGISYAHAGWDDANLAQQIAAFGPDLMFVVHGRRFVQRYHNLRVFGVPMAVWLLDEPYEVDDTSAWSMRFDHVFVSDPASIARHENASYLPVCYDPHIHKPSDVPRRRRVGFIGGGNGTRDRYLSALAREGVLDYVVGGEWADLAVQRLCLGRNIPPALTAGLYQQTRIVLNVFRETHHFNRDKIAGWSLNPRVYEAFACGALVVSEWREEIEYLVPELPAFRSEGDCVAIIRDLLAAPEKAEAIRVACAARLEPHTYASRLRQVCASMGVEVAA